MSYTTLYGLFALTSILLFNCLILLARYVRQVKEPPKDEEFEKLIADKKRLEFDYESKKAELDETEARIKKVEEKLQKTEDTLQAKLTELQALKNGQGASPVSPQPAAPTGGA